MAVPILPSAKAVLSEFLATHPQLTPIHGGRASTSLSGKYPAQRISRIGGAQTQEWEDIPLLQIESWADDESTADRLGRTTLAVLPDIVGRRPFGTVTGYEVESHLEDYDSETKRFRSLLTVRLLSYANPT